MSLGWQAVSPYVDTPFPDHLPKDCFSKSKEKLQLIGTEFDEDFNQKNNQPFCLIPNRSPQKRAEKRQSKSRQDKARFRTTPVTFEEISEVDEEFLFANSSANQQSVTDNNSLMSDHNSNNLHDNDSWHFLTKDDLLFSPKKQLLRTQQSWHGYLEHQREFCLNQFDPVGNSMKHANGKPLLKHHRSHESLPVQHKLSLPPIPEALSPSNGVMQAFDLDSL